MENGSFHLEIWQVKVGMYVESLRHLSAIIDSCDSFSLEEKIDEKRLKHCMVRSQSINQSGL